MTLLTNYFKTYHFEVNNTKDHKWSLIIGTIFRNLLLILFYIVPMLLNAKYYCWSYCWQFCSGLWVTAWACAVALRGSALTVVTDGTNVLFMLSSRNRNWKRGSLSFSVFVLPSCSFLLPRASAALSSVCALFA